jgi:protein-L-isoaspartate(D-aspartate) O-methyltransferase
LSPFLFLLCEDNSSTLNIFRIVKGESLDQLGWIVPPPHEPTKRKGDFEKERVEKVERLQKEGFLRSERIRAAMLKVAREDFIPFLYRDYAYWEVPLPLPGEKSTISCPHSYPLFYEPLGLDEGHRFLEVGLGSGYGAALAREVVGKTGLVVAMEIDSITYEFGRTNLRQAGFEDIIVVQGDGGLGFPERAPYDRICLTAACSKIPTPLIEQLNLGGRLIAPVRQQNVQNLVMVEKHEKGTIQTVVCEVLYVPMRGQFGMKV